MIERIWTSPKKREQLERNWLYRHLDDYLEFRASQGYALATISNSAFHLIRYAAYLHTIGKARLQEIPNWVDDYVTKVNGRTTRLNVRWAIGQFSRFLRKESLINDSKRTHPAPRFYRWVSAYEHQMREQRGLAEPTIVGRRAYCIKFLKSIYDMGARKISQLGPRHVQQFILNEATGYGRQTMLEYCSILRDFLIFLYQNRITEANLSTAVVSPKSFGHERSPRFLSRDEIQSVLRCVDRNTSIGRRNYAMLLLLSTYGLRGIEIVRMKLDDIAWQAEKLHLRNRKGRHDSIYPLTSSVAEALVDYLKKGRPTTTHREIFLTDAAPFRPVQTVAVRHVLKKYLRAAGLESRGAGAHTLRYSCAQRLFDEDFSIKVIGDYLGHRNLDTTLRYVKIDLKGLREVAVNSGEEML